MLSLALVIGPWLSLRTKLQSLVLALKFQSFVESFCHNRLVVQWYWPWFTWLGNAGWSLRPTTVSTQPLLSYVLCSPATSAPVERVLSWVDCSSHASKSSTNVQLSVGNFGLLEMQQFCLCVMLLKLNATYGIGLCSRIEHWRTVMNYSTDKIWRHNLLLYTEHVFWFQLLVIGLIFGHITFTTDLCGASKM